MDSGALSKQQASAIEEPSSSRAVLAAFALGGIVLLLLTFRLELVFDDAYISFRYSKNLADGNGLRFNLGVEPPVEGYSNLLWVLWCAIPEWLGLRTTVWAQWSNLLCGFGLLALVLRFAARRFVLGTPALFATSIFLATLPPMAVYSTGGLETMAFALAIFAIYERLVGEEGRVRTADAAIAGVCAVLLRPDGILWCGVIIALCGGRALMQRNSKLRNAAIIVGALCVAAFLSQTAWRLSYHGDWVANTVRAKASMSAMSFERGSKYMLSYFAHFPTIGVVLILACVRLFFLRKANPIRNTVLIESLLFFGAMLAYSIAVGGDFLPMGRFVLPAVPFMALLFALLVERALAKPRALPILIACVFLGLSALPNFDRYVVPESVRSLTHYNWNLPDYRTEIKMLDGERERSLDWGEMGRALKQHAESTDSFVIGTVGAAGYYSDLFLYDQHGLVNREVAALPWHGLRNSAGHDRYAPVKFFAAYSPTYSRVALIDLDANGQPTDPKLRLNDRQRRP